VLNLLGAIGVGVLGWSIWKWKAGYEVNTMFNATKRRDSERKLLRKESSNSCKIYIKEEKIIDVNC
jgi:hypothetical protein